MHFSWASWRPQWTSHADRGDVYACASVRLQTNKRTNKQTSKQTNKHTHKPTDSQSARQTGRQTNKQTKQNVTQQSQTSKQASKWTTDRPTGRPTYRQNKPMGRMTYEHMHIATKKSRETYSKYDTEERAAWNKFGKQKHKKTPESENRIYKERGRRG